MKILTIGSATVDIFLNFEGADTIQINKKFSQKSYMLFESGEKIEIDELLYFSGGGATNSAVSFKRLGLDVTCFSKIGKDSSARKIIDDLEKENINTKTIISQENTTTAKSFIISTRSGERTIFAYRGANTTLEINDIPVDLIENSNLIYITSLSGKSSEILPKIIKIAREKNIPVSINPGISQLASGMKILKEILPYVDTLILNSLEARRFMVSLIETDIEYKQILRCFEESKICSPYSYDQDSSQTPKLLQGAIPYEKIYLSIQNFFKAILDLGTKTVVVTDGAQGVYVAQTDQILFYPSLKVKVIDTVGAGDAFASCFSALRLMGKSLEDALIYGIINSASVINYIGAKKGLLTLDQLKQKANSTPKSLLQQFPL